MELFLFGLRNVLRNKRRSSLNVIALSIGIILMVLFIGWMRGYFSTLYNAIIKFDTGHIQVLDSGYLDKERMLPFDLNVERYSELRDRLSRDPRVADVTGRINYTLTLTYGNKSLRVMGTGIDPSHEKNVTVLAEHISDGNYNEKESGILVGKPLAEKLGIKTGSTVFISGPDKYSAINMIDAKVTGIFNYGYPAMDRNIVFTDLATTGRLLGLGDEVTRIVIKLKPGYTVQDVLPAIQTEIKGTGLTAYPWEQFAQVLISAANQDLVTFGLLLIVLYVVIIIGILNSMHMSIRERIKELSTLRAIGIRKGKLIRLLVSESIGLALFATVISIAVGSGLAAYLQFVGFDVSAMFDANVAIPFGDRMTGDFRWFDFPICILIGVATAIAGTLLPAYKASKLNIAQTMGTNNLV